MQLRSVDAHACRSHRDILTRSDERTIKSY
jgi:hypothetical protein